MRIALTGTPGTGKSSVAEELRKLGEAVHDINALALAKGFVLRRDRLRDSAEIDLRKLKRHCDNIPRGEGHLILESHLSHYLDVDWAVVLRCKPSVLRKRLGKRGYPQDKIRENSLAEALDTILVEAVGSLGEKNIVEIDTTSKKPAAVALIISGLVHSGFRGASKYSAGKIDWSADILRSPGYYTKPPGRPPKT
jgi:adenylate kinase